MSLENCLPFFAALQLALEWVHPVAWRIEVGRSCDAEGSSGVVGVGVRVGLA